MQAQCLCNQERTARWLWIRLRILQEILTVGIENSVEVFDSLCFKRVINHNCRVVHNDVDSQTRFIASGENVRCTFQSYSANFNRGATNSRTLCQWCWKARSKKTCSHVRLERTDCSGWVDFPNLFHDSLSFRGWRSRCIVLPECEWVNQANERQRLQWGRWHQLWLSLVWFVHQGPLSRRSQQHSGQWE